MAKAGDGKKTAQLGFEAEANQFYQNFILDAQDQYNDILNKRFSDRTQQDQYASYVEGELLNRGLQIDSFDKQYQAYQQGLDYIDMAAQTAFDQELLGYQQNLRGIESDFANLDLANRRNQLQSYYATKGIDTALANNALDQENIQNSIKNLRIEDRKRRDLFGAQMTEQSNQMAKQAADGRLQMLTAALEGQAAAGNAKNTGRRGNTANTAIRSAQTLSSINSEAVVDNLERSNESFKNSVFATTSEYTKQKKQTALQIGSLENNKAKLKNNRKQLKDDKREVAAMLGITQEQFEMDTATLSQMYMDALPAFENVVERISNSVYKDKTNLFNKMPLPPQFAGLAEAPYDVPLPERVPRTLLGPNQYDSDQFAIPQPSTNSGSGGLFGSIGAVLGTVAGIALAPATGGASALFASASLGGSIGGGLGSVVDSFSY